jgi:Rrf2 family protein
VQLSQTVEYRLRAAVWLAGRPSEPQTTAQIAKGTQVPASYLSKILQGLVRNGLVNSQRGVGGGFSLVKDSAEVSLLEIVEAVEPLPRIRSCPLKIPGHGTDLCALHRTLDDAFARIEESFASTRLAEMVSPDNTIHPLCASPKLVNLRRS